MLHFINNTVLPLFRRFVWWFVAVPIGAALIYFTVTYILDWFSKPDDIGKVVENSTSIPAGNTANDRARVQRYIDCLRDAVQIDDKAKRIAMWKGVCEKL